MGMSQAAPSVTKITGGGQTLVPEGGGAGDTVGFNAQVDDAGNVKGQFQYVNRNGTGTGQAQEVAHGVVTCAAVFSRPDGGGSGGVAAFGGTFTDGTAFRVDVHIPNKLVQGMTAAILQAQQQMKNPNGGLE
jgi:hypothetical protein